MPSTQVSSVYLTPSFSNVPSSCSSVRLLVEESVSGGKFKEVFRGEEQKVSSDAVTLPPLRLILLLSPEALQQFYFKLINGDNSVIGSIQLKQEDILASSSEKPWKLTGGGSSASASSSSSPKAKQQEDVNALAEEMYQHSISMQLAIQQTGGENFAGRQKIQWVHFPKFDRSASREQIQKDASPSTSTFEIEVGVSGLFSFDALYKSSPLVSVHISGGGPIDHTEGIPSVHSTVFTQRLMVHPGVVLRVYDVSCATGLDDSLIIGSTMPLSLAQLQQGEEIELLNMNEEFNRKLKKKGAAIKILSVKQLGVVSAAVASPKAQATSSPKAVATPKGSPKADAGLQVQVPPPSVQPSVSSRTPVVVSSTPYDSSALSFNASQIVIVDGSGKESRAPSAAGSKSPKSPSKSGATVSLNLSARNLPKVNPLSTNISPLVAIWERKEGDEYVLLAHTEPIANQSDPAFASTLTFTLAPQAGASASSPKVAASPKASSSGGEYRLDVYDVFDARIYLPFDRVGFAYLTRDELLAVNSLDFSAEKPCDLSSANEKMQKKLTARRSQVVLTRAGAPIEAQTERELIRSKTVQEKRTAREKAAAKLQAKRTGIPLPESPKPVEPVPAMAAVVEEKKEPEAAVPSGLPPLGKSAGSRRGSFNAGYAGLSAAGAGSRRGSLNGADAESTADMDNAILAEKVAQARVIDAKAVVEAFHGAGKKNKVAEERHAAELDLANAEKELAIASERAAEAKKELAARRKARAEAAEAEAKRKTEADAAAAADPNHTKWGVRKRGPSMHNIPHVASGSAKNSPSGSMSLSNGGELKEMITARKMAAQAPAAQAQLALLSSGSSSSSSSSVPSKSTFLCVNVSVKHINNSGAWNPLVAFYEESSAADKSGKWIYLDSTEKIAGVGETGTGKFSKQILLESLAGDKEQSVRIMLFNAGDKNEAGASDLIACASISLSKLLESFSGDKKNSPVELNLVSPHNKAVSERLKRQGAAVELSLAAMMEDESSTQTNSLILGHAPVPLVMEGGAIESEVSGAAADNAAEAAAAAAPASKADDADEKQGEQTEAAAGGDQKKNKKNKKKAGK